VRARRGYWWGDSAGGGASLAGCHSRAVGRTCALSIARRLVARQPPLTAHHPHPAHTPLSYDYHDNYAVHLWTSADAGHRERLSRLSINDIFYGNGSFHRVARKLLRDAESKGALCGYASEQVRAWEAAGGVAGPAGLEAAEARAAALGLK